MHIFAKMIKINMCRQRAFRHGGSLLMMDTEENPKTRKLTSLRIKERKQGQCKQSRSWVKKEKRNGVSDCWGWVEGDFFFLSISLAHEDSGSMSR